MLARLETLREETLRANNGRPMSHMQIWEVLSDVAPSFNHNLGQSVLMDAEIVETNSPIMGVSIGVGAVAALITAAVSMDSITAAGAVRAKQPISSPSDVVTSQSTTSEDNKLKSAPIVAVEQTGNKPRWPHWLMQQINAKREPSKQLSITGFGAFEEAKGLGWQAALKSQNPPYSPQHWEETADLWSTAIAYLGQVTPEHESYTAAQAKKAVYQKNLQEIQKRQREAVQRTEMASASRNAKDRSSVLTCCRTSTSVCQLQIRKSAKSCQRLRLEGGNRQSKCSAPP